jgi:signal transduction histidine kinase
MLKTTTTQVLEGRYAEILKEYCESGAEEALYRASLLSHEFIGCGVPPDEIVAMHARIVEQVVKPYDTKSLVASQQLLLEVMIAYGVRYSEYAEFRLAEARRTAETEHARADQATRAEQERLELLAVIAHELATPLTVAKGNVSAIRRFLADNNRLSHDLSTRAIDAEVAIERLLRLREELLAASRNEPKEMELGPLSVESAVRRAVKWAETPAMERHIQLRYQLESNGALVLADPDALQSILGNLLSNAVRYTPAGGTVIVTTRVEGARVCIDVSDTGIGMSAETQANLFQRFYRAPEAKRMASWGLGLGLTIASELAQSLGGTIGVVSEEGKGSVFTVYLPAAQGSEAEE